MAEYRDLLEEIRKNKKYASISEDLIKQEIDRYFRINPKHISLLEKPQSEKFKNIVKAIRNKLHLIYGSFQAEDKSKRLDYLKELKGIDDYETAEKVLSTSVSAKERLEEYDRIYKEIFRITGKPDSILDLGCGLNPISYSYMDIKELTYRAYDIDKKDVDFLNSYFEKMKKFSRLDGKAFLMNLTDLNEVKRLPKSDICFMFKLVDPLEKGKNHKLSEEMIKNIDSKYIIISFSTKTISGKPMNYPYRGWIEKMLNRIGLNFEKILANNEVFYVIKK